MDKAQEGLLANASATGGLRGGNIQRALGEFRPEILSRAINQRFNQLTPMSQTGAEIARGLYGTGANLSQYLAGAGGNVGQNLYSTAGNVTQNIANLGQASAARTGAMGQTAATNIGNLLAQAGAAQAGGALAAGTARADMAQGLADFGGDMYKIWQDRNKRAVL